MRYGLGIDAGGTYTDVALVDFETKRVIAKGKALTTKQDLGIGIGRALDTLPGEALLRADLVSLSTTLATNAIVEDKGNKVAALLLGFDAYDLAKIGHAPVRVIRGRTDIQGDELEPLDEEGLRRAVEELERTVRPDAYAVSGMVGVKNPAHEQRAKALVHGLTGKTVVCGHEVSTQLNTIKRTNTAILNARLLPIISELIGKVEAGLAGRGIHAPLMIVRADGTLMPESTARKYPVETILSGPAASIWGARFLTGIDDGLVVDIGGTTSDIALISGGQPVVSLSGASISTWETHVRSVDIDTVGLAGDSALSVSRDRRLSIGPRKAIPLAVLGFCDENIETELERLWAIRERRSSLVQPVEFYRLAKADAPRELSGSEERVLDILGDGPLSRDRMADLTGATDPSLVPVARLETLGFIERSALTPTDMLHVSGVFSRWNARAAELGVRLTAPALGVAPAALPGLVLEEFARRLAERLVARVLRQKDGFANPSAFGTLKELLHDNGLMRLLLSGTDHLGFSLAPQYGHPLIAIGAPAGVLAPAAARLMGASLVVPAHAEVANAVGAITGMQSIVVEAAVSPKGGGFVAHTPDERREFKNLEAAKSWAERQVSVLLEERIREDGQPELEYHRSLQVKDNVAETQEGSVFVECIVRASAVSRTAFFRP